MPFGYKPGSNCGIGRDTRFLASRSGFNYTLRRNGSCCLASGFNSIASAKFSSVRATKGSASSCKA